MLVRNAQLKLQSDCGLPFLATSTFSTLHDQSHEYWTHKIVCFHMTPWRPYFCPKPVAWELNSFLMYTLSFVPINLHRCRPREWKHKIDSDDVRKDHLSLDNYCTHLAWRCLQTDSGRGTVLSWILSMLCGWIAVRIYQSLITTV